MTNLDTDVGVKKERPNGEVKITRSHEKVFELTKNDVSTADSCLPVMFLHLYQRREDISGIGKILTGEKYSQ